jgi:hypothetical protein
MSKRASPSGITLNKTDAAIIKGMLIRGDRQHDVAAYFGVNPGRVAEIATGRAYPTVPAVPEAALPPSGPYTTAVRDIVALEAKLAKAQATIEALKGNTEKTV